MNNLFQDLTEKQREKILKTLEAFTVKFTKGINIIDYMNRKNTIGVVIKGGLSITLEEYDGTSILIDEVRENDIFGAMMSTVILEDECAITTKDETYVTFIDYDNITNTEIIKSDFYITFIQNLLKLISDQIQNKNERIQILTKKNIREKLLAYLNMQYKRIGYKTFDLPMSLTNLAHYLAVDRSAMMREIRNLKDDGFIESKGKRVRLLY